MLIYSDSLHNLTFALRTQMCLVAKTWNRSLEPQYIHEKSDQQVV